VAAAAGATADARGGILGGVELYVIVRPRVGGGRAHLPHDPHRFEALGEDPDGLLRRLGAQQVQRMFSVSSEYFFQCGLVNYVGIVCIKR
jgi:hypothetical protein